MIDNNLSLYSLQPIEDISGYKIGTKIGEK